tara:strand:- start:103806 stop:104771 length:966 start_codon:yes stop_codon:yes gene_type:complete
LSTELNIDILILKSFDGSLNEEEKAKLDLWLKEDIAHQSQFEELEKIWTCSKEIKPIPELNIDQEWNKFKNRHFSKEKPKLINLFASKALKYAAVFIVLIFSASLYFFTSTNYKTQEFRKTIYLADGSRVELNAHSELKVSRSFNWFNRSMALKGEAYFEVEPNPEKPFIIHSERAHIEVLGTSFNFNSELEKPMVSVTSGKVAFWGNSKEQAIYLEKGEEGILEKGKLKQGEIEDPNFLAWHSGVFNFKNENLENALQQLSTYYQVEFILEDQEKLANCNITSQFNKNSLEEVFNEFEILMNFKIEKIQNEYHFKNGSCY